MGVTDTLSRGRERVGVPVGTLLVGLFAAVLAVDLVLKLLGVDAGMLGGTLGFERFLSNIWTGLVIGMVLGLGGIGLSMTYSILNFANFAHGDLLSVGGFTGWGVAYVVAGLGAVPVGELILVRAAGDATPGQIGAHVLTTPGALFAGLLVAALATGLLSVGLDRVVYKPMRDRSGIALLIASVGVALALRYLVVFFYGSRNRGVTASVEGSSVDLFGLLTVSAHQLAAVLAAAVLMAAMHFLLQRTKLGTAMRAMADNKDLALVTGIPTERIVTATWFIGGGMAGAAGYLTVMYQGAIAFDFGWQLLLLIFAAVILGGIGSIYGAISGGLIIGLVFALSTVWIPADFNEAAAFAVMILALLFRPQGLFSGVTTA
ncbi:branched-chain amino acid ABC transporter permease [Halosegnis marinus]|uniref:Branched-chain amino acid ABC transporter permease n=1 Tax=Halosegnis marinus TaxID=3034023 RepID=A0ABD5ZS03_9EURY|nr:branched-chain amino acid ABC transporter permease [Halosegnis sp. DT85]